MRYFVIIFLIQLCSGAVVSQDIASANLVWETDQTTDLQTNEVKPYLATFKTNGIQSLDWIQKGGQLSSHYKIVSVDGTWGNVNNLGTVTFLMERNGKNLRAMFERNVSGMFVTMIYPGTAGDSKLRFRIKSITTF